MLHKSDSEEKKVRKRRQTNTSPTLKCVFILLVCSHGMHLFAQSSLLNLSVKNATLHQVLKEIKKQSGKNMIYNNNLIDPYDHETFELNNVKLDEALKAILEGKNLSFKIVDDVIIIEPQAEKQSTDKLSGLNQTIKGSVFDIESNNPLIGATVIIQESNPVKGTSTDLNGNYQLEKVPVGRYHIKVSYVGYQPKIVSEILVTTGKEVVLPIGLKQSLTQISDVTITVSKDKPLNTMATVSARSFTVEETRRYAGGLDDPARMASAFAGVAVGNIQSNGIIIRGNAPRALSWRLEDIDIPSPNHAAGSTVEGGGFVTIFSSQLLTNSDFYTGAFPAEYGNALAGVFDMKLRVGNKEKYEQTFQAGVLGIDLSSEGPIGKKNGSSYLINYRYSTIGLLKNLGLLKGKGASYQDLSFKFNFPTSKAGTFSFWGIGGLDNATGSDEPDSAKWKYSSSRLHFTYDQNMGAIGLTHRYVIGEKTYIRTTIAGSGTQINRDMTRLNDSLVRKPYLHFMDNGGKITLSSVLNHKFNASNTLRSGADYHLLFYNEVINGTIADNNPASYRNFVNQSGYSNLTELFTEDKYDISEKITFTGGLHFSYFSLNGDYSLEPRAAFTWQFAPKQSLSFGYGKHSQMEQMRIYLVKFQQNGKDYYPNKNLGFAQSHHFVLGYDWSITDNLRLKIEPYFQYLYNVPGIRDSSFSMINFSQELAFHDSLNNNSQGRNMGIDFTLERFLSNNFYYMITLSLIRSTYKAGDGIWHNTMFNKGFVTNLLFGKEFFVRNNKMLGLNGRLNLLGGDRYSPYRADPVRKDVVFDETKAFEKQYPVTYYLDLTITYRINKLKYSGVWALQVKNLLGSPSRSGFNYNYHTGEVNENDATVILPVLSYKIEF